MVVRGMRRQGLKSSGRARGALCFGLGAILIGLVLGPSPSLAAKGPARITWIRGEAWALSAKAPARFHPGLLLDGKPKTVGCFSSDPEVLLGSTFTIGFSGRAKVNELRIVNGDGRGGAAFAKSARVAKLSLLEPTYERSISLADTSARQVVHLDPPLSSDRVTIRIDAVQGEGSRVCLSDLIFVSRKKALNGPFLARHLAWKGPASRIMGTWAAGPAGAPEKFLTLSFDGRYRFVYRPNDTDLRGLVVTGTWTLQGKRLRLRGGGGPVLLGLRLGHEEDEMGEVVQTILLRGKASGKKKLVPDRYRDRF